MPILMVARAMPMVRLLTRSGSRAPSWALAALARQVRISPCALSMPIWFL